MQYNSIHDAEGTVDLIASGYDWHCPGCGRTNKEIEIYKAVECPNCGRSFKVSDCNHAFS